MFKLLSPSTSCPCTLTHRLPVTYAWSNSTCLEMVVVSACRTSCVAVTFFASRASSVCLALANLQTCCVSCLLDILPRRDASRKTSLRECPFCREIFNPHCTRRLVADVSPLYRSKADNGGVVFAEKMAQDTPETEYAPYPDPKRERGWPFNILLSGYADNPRDVFFCSRPFIFLNFSGGRGLGDESRAKQTCTNEQIYILLEQL
jgi:hypothetical protein